MTKAALWVLLLAACESYGGDDVYTSPPDPTPVARDDQLNIAEGAGFTNSSLTQNDTDVNVVDIKDPPQHGTIVDGTYVPEPGYFGDDQLTYSGRFRSYSQESSALATVHITITSDGIPYERSSFLATSNVTSLAAGDIDGDGKIDLVSCSFYDSEMTVFRNTTAAEGMYSLEPHVFEGGSNPARVAVADLDGDGKLDVITASDDGVTIFRNITQPAGAIAFEGPVRLGNVPFAALVAVDLNADGRPDLAGAEARTYSSSSLHTWINQSTPGTLAFGVDTTFTTPVNPFELTAVDVDANGQVDLALLADGKLSVFVNATGAAAAVVAFQSRVDRDTGPDPRTMFLADLDADTHAELGVLHDGGDLWIYQNRGTTSPTFEAARVLSIDSSTRIVTPVDFAGSGVNDLIGIRGGSSNQFQLLKNISQPQLFAFDAVTANVSDTSTRRLASFGTPTSLVFVDLDGVPPLELAVGSNGSGGIRVLFGP